MAYQEPPRLFQPIRHCLGYVLSNVTGDHAGAEAGGRSPSSLLCGAAVAEVQPRFADREAQHSRFVHEPVRAAQHEGIMAWGMQAYREDLLELPGNGWSLLGLGLSLKARGEPEADTFLMTHYPAVWKDADALIESSCPVFSQL